MLTFLSNAKKKQFFQKIKLSISLINITLKLNWSSVDEIFKNKSCKQSKASEMNYVKCQM